MDLSWKHATYLKFTDVKDGACNNVFDQPAARSPDLCVAYQLKLKRELAILRTSHENLSVVGNAFFGVPRLRLLGSDGPNEQMQRGESS